MTLDNDLNKNNDFNNFKIITIYSTIAYLTAYYLVFLSYNIITASFASAFDIKTILYHHKLLFVTSDRSNLWDFDSAVTVFGSGTLFLIIVIASCLLVYRKYAYIETEFKIFLFWIVLHSINRVLGTFSIGTIFHLYFSNVLLYWFYVDVWVRIILIIVVLALIFAIGNYSTQPLLLTARTFNYVDDKKRDFFIIAQAIRPWFYSTIILFFLHLPSYSFAENLLSVTMLFMLVPGYFNNENLETPESNRPEPEIAYKMPWKYLIILCVFIIIFRIILAFGIPF